MEARHHGTKGRHQGYGVGTNTYLIFDSNAQAPSNGTWKSLTS